MKLVTFNNIDTFADGVHPVLLKPFLRREGFVIDHTTGGYIEHWVHSQYPDIKLDIHNNITTTPPRDLLHIKEICAQAHKRALAPTPAVAAGALPNWLTLESGYQGKVDEGVLYVWKDEHPEFRMRFSEKPGERNVGAAYKAAFDAYNASLNIYSHTITELQRNYGFEVRVKGNDVIIEQPDYELTYTFPLNNHVDLLKELNGIEEAAAGVYLARMEQYENLLRHATNIKEVPAAADGANPSIEIHLSSQKAPIVIAKHGPLGRIDAASAKAISRALETIAAAKAATAAPAAQQPEHVEPELAQDARTVEPEKPAPQEAGPDIATPPPLAKEVLPSGQKASLIFDKSALQNLEADRGGDRTWMDLLPITAALPTIDKIYIPAIVADWESRGGITRRNSDGKTEFQVIDRRVANPKYSKGAKELFATASRLVRDADGKGHLIPGKNPNIIIYESPIDHMFTDEIKKIWDDQSIGFAEKAQRIGDFRGKTAKDFGERSMEAIAQELENQGPAYLVCDDIKYLLHRKEITTKDGFPVGEAKSTGYIEAVIAAHGNDVAHQLEHKYGVPVGKMHIDPIKAQILQLEKWRGHKELPNGYPSFKAFPYMSSAGRVSGESLEAIFRRGSVIQHGDEAPYDYAKYPLPAQLAKSHPHLVVATAAAVDGKAAPAEPAPDATAAAIPPTQDGAAIAGAAAAGALSVAAVAAAKLATDTPVVAPTDKVVTPGVTAPAEPERTNLRWQKPLSELITDAYPAPKGEPPVMRAAETVAGKPLVSLLPEKAKAPAAAPASSPSVVTAPAPAVTATDSVAKNVATAIQPPDEEKAMSLPFEETLGYKIGYHRIQRNISEADLAHQVKKIAIYRPDVDEDMVFRWQTNQELPQAELYEALVHVLVTNNDKVTDKEAAKQEFKDAYQRSMKALEAGGKDASREDSFAFVNTLRKFRKQADLMDDDALAHILKGSLKSDITESPDTIDAMLMFKIGANAHRPSPGMMQAIVKVLGLAPDEQAEILSVYAGERKAVAPEAKAIAPMPSAAPAPITPAAAPATQVLPEGRATEVSESIIAGRIALDAWVKENIGLSGAAIATEAGITRNDFQFLASTSRRPMEIGIERLTDNAKKIAAVFEKRGIAADKVQEFRKFTDALIGQAALEREQKARSGGR